MSECTHDCGSCSSGCATKDVHESLRKGACVKKVIGIVSGKGGVGKSLVTSLLAAKMQKSGYKAAVLDADITGPSIPKTFGVTKEKAMATEEEAILPIVTKSGLQLMSMNFLLDNETDPVIWRGSLIASAVKQFWTDVLWDNVDFMFVDMPPGTGDVPLTVFQSLPIDGIIVVSSPQDLVRIVVEKAVKMANTMKIPVLGLVENMSFVKCPDCNKEIKIFGDSHIDEIARSFHLPVLARIPMEEATAKAVDEGKLEDLELPYLADAVKAVEALKA